MKLVMEENDVKVYLTTVILLLGLSLCGCSSNKVQFTKIVKNESISKISIRLVLEQNS